MTKDIKRLDQLREITDAILLSEQSRLAAIAADERRLTALLSQLDEVSKERANALRDAPDPAARAGADPRWQRWAEGRRRALNPGTCTAQGQA